MHSLHHIEVTIMKIMEKVKRIYKLKDNTRTSEYKIERIYELPFSDTGCLGNIHIESDGGDLRLKYEFDTNQSPKVGTIVFKNTIAFRFQNERHSGIIADGSTCALVSISPSEWLKELLRWECYDDYFTVKKCRHFSIFLSSNGYLEVISQSFCIEQEEKGDLQQLRIISNIE